METTPRLTDIQYAVYECGLSIADVAARIGTTNTMILTELATTPMPLWLRQRQDNYQGTGP